ncbi:MAG: efflux RND transporter periplasmic adaptor subunit [Verrucomicrobiales bacterium]|nr:efflux RND transporter periplasmic adaptor subunit [Verrucomicrobiales bacterium]
MKYYLLFIILISSALLPGLIHAQDKSDDNRAAATVILDQTAVENLRIQTVVAEERDFEATVFAIGRIEEIPEKRYAVSSRISGRTVKVNAFVGDQVKKGQVLIEVESRQPGDPPPIISIKASHDGLVIDSHVRIGQPVDPESELLDITDRTKMWAIAKIPEQAAAKVKIGTKAYIRIPALGDSLIEAKVLRYGVTADREAGTIEGIFEIANTNGKLYPGMRAEFSIVTSQRKNVLAVPRTSVQGDPTKRVVYVKDFDLPNAFVRVPVVLGKQNERFVEVLNGVFPGDDVVTQGSYSLGFAGGGSGISLKDALDAAHGHEHNEDGSEVSDDAKKGDDGAENSTHKDHNESSSSGNLPKWLMIYSALVTLLLVVVAQLYSNLRKTSTSA